MGKGYVPKLVTPNYAEGGLIADTRLSDDGRTLTVRVPMAFAKRGGRNSVISLADVSSLVSSRPQIDSTLVKALARAFRWRRQLETGVYATIDEMVAAEKIDSSYVCRVLRLTLLAPDIVEAILNGRQSAGMTLAALMKPFVVDWNEQHLTRL